VKSPHAPPRLWRWLIIGAGCVAVLLTAPWQIVVGLLFACAIPVLAWFADEVL
jgi:hypothetical protein